jgi:probable HAF family extracellular repeat protein
MRMYLAAVLAAAALLPVEAHAQAYKVVDLGELGGGASWAYSINNAGQVVGTSVNAEFNFRAFLLQQRRDGRSRHSRWPSG